MYRIQCLVLLSLFYFSSAAKVTWLPNTNFNLPTNFKDGKLPCSKQTVVFPESVSSSVLIEVGVLASEFILPIDGELILAEGTFELGPSENANCSEGNVYYLEKSISSWAQPDVWSSIKFNAATPDSERIPCLDDVVEFPSNSEFTVSLPETTQRVKEIRLGNTRYMDTSQFSEYVTSQSDQRQQFILNSNENTGVIIDFIHNHCTSVAGCPCQTEELKIDCSAKYCTKPACIDPIQPKGHCCKICGGYVIFEADQGFSLVSFIAQVESEIKKYDKNLVYHVGRLQNNKVQLIVVEKEEYTGASAEFVNSLNIPRERQLLQISGIPIYKSGLSGKISILMFFAVVAVMGAIYVYYYRLPKFNFSIFDRLGRSHVVSRFYQRSESVLSLTRRDSGVGISSTSRAFRNPMYDSKRQRVIVEESANEETSVDE